MKQLLQDARTGDLSVNEVAAPQLLPGCVLVRTAASLVSAGTERASAEFARKSLLAKGKARPDLAAMCSQSSSAMVWPRQLERSAHDSVSRNRPVTVALAR